MVYDLIGKTNLNKNYIKQITRTVVVPPMVAVTMTYRWNLSWGSNTTFSAATPIAVFGAPKNNPSPFSTLNWTRVQPGYLLPDSAPNINSVDGIFQVLKIVEPSLDGGDCTATGQSTVTFVDQFIFGGSVTIYMYNPTKNPVQFQFGRIIGLGFNRPNNAITRWQSDVATPRLSWNSYTVNTSKTIGQTVFSYKDTTGQASTTRFSDTPLSVGWCFEPV